MLVEQVLDVDLRTKPAEIITRRCVDERVGRQVAGRAVDLGLDRADIADATADKGIAEFIARINTRRALRRSEEHTSELQSLMRISYAVFCLKKKKNTINT